MTTTEFSNNFDVLYNNITSNQAPGLNEYEKSVFLTKAQNELVKNYFDKNSKGNNTQRGFDESAIRQMDYKNLLRSVEKPAETTIQPIIDPRALVFKLPADVFVIINEQIFLYSGDSSNKSNLKGFRTIIPIAYDEYMRLMSKPFKEPVKWQAWRLISNYSSNDTNIEVVTTSYDKNTYPVRTYVVRYVKKPDPIILTNLTSAFGEGLSIDGKTEVTECELNSSVHEAILQRAVELAKIAWGGDQNNINTEVQAGQRSE